MTFLMIFYEHEEYIIQYNYIVFYLYGFEAEFVVFLDVI